MALQMSNYKHTRPLLLTHVDFKPHVMTKTTRLFVCGSGREWERERERVQIFISDLETYIVI